MNASSSTLSVAQVFEQALQLKGRLITLSGQLNLGIECQELVGLAGQEITVPGNFCAAIWLEFARGKKLLNPQWHGRHVVVTGKLSVASALTWPGLGHMGGYYLELRLSKPPQPA